jgi:hypothetical protein
MSKKFTEVNVFARSGPFTPAGPAAKLNVVEQVLGRALDAKASGQMSSESPR